MAISVSAQQYSQMGLHGGVAYYMGELNQGKPFYKAQPSYGILFRRNFNPHYSLRIGFSAGNIQGDDTDSKNAYSLDRNYKFKTFIGEWSARMEFNFLPMKPKALTGSPYLTAGLAMAVIPNTGAYPIQFIIPFGVGYKYKLSKKVGVALEWTFHKSFTDNLDKLTPEILQLSDALAQEKQKTQLFNKDWYSFAGIIFTFDIAGKRGLCPAYSTYQKQIR